MLSKTKRKNVGLNIAVFLKLFQWRGNDALNYYNLCAITTQGLVLSASPPRLMYLLCSILLPLERSERSPMAPLGKQVIALIDRLIYRILHCCSSPASREN